MAQRDWRFDEVRRLRYWYDGNEDSFVFEDGQRLRRNSNVPRNSDQRHQGNQTVPSQPFHGGLPTQGSTYSLDRITAAQQTASSRQHDTLGHATVSPADRPHSQRPDLASGNLSGQMESLALNPQPSPSTVHGSSNASHSWPSSSDIRSTQEEQDGIRSVRYVDASTGLSTTIASGPARLITDPALLTRHIPAHKKVSGPTGDTDRLFTGFRLRRHEFFEVGRVFLVLWVEPAGNTATPTTQRVAMDRVDSGLLQSRFGEYAYHKIRRFVVIRSAHNYCSALRIVTYGGRGVSNPSVKKSEHAIIYTGDEEPEPHQAEMPTRGESPMRDRPIRVVPDQQDEQLDRMSRIDFGKVHTIQHNIKVQSYGMVHPHFYNDLQSQFYSVWQDQMSSGTPSSPPSNTISISPLARAGPSSTQGASNPVAGSASRRGNEPLPTRSQGRLQSPEQQRSNHARLAHEAGSILSALRTYRQRGYTLEQAYGGVARALMNRHEGLTRESAIALVRATQAQATAGGDSADSVAEGEGNENGNEDDDEAGDDNESGDEDEAGDRDRDEDDDEDEDESHE